MSQTNSSPRQVRLFPVFPAVSFAVATFFFARAANAADKDVAVFPFELIDSSLEGAMMGKNPDETERLERMAPALREDIDALEGFAVVDIAPVRGEEMLRDIRSCDVCDLDYAEELGADISVTGTVQKVSNLILNINAYAKDVETGELIARGSADIRSNTDESWNRGIEYLWQNVLKGQFEAMN